MAGRSSPWTADTTLAQSRRELENEGAPPAARGLWRDAFNRYRRNRMAMAGLILALFIVLCAWIGPVVSPYDYARQDLFSVNQPPSWHHWMGTDGLGRDYLTRIMMGGRTALLVAMITVGISSILGLIIGASSAFFGGWVDGITMRIADTVLSFPHLLLAMFIVGTVRPPVTKWLGQLGVARDAVLPDYLLVFGALAAVGWAGESRLVRSQVLSLRRSEFVLAARALGASDRRIIGVHIMPNALGSLIVSASSSFGGAMLAESSLSFLGVGIKPPGASWGNMISENLATWRYEPHLLAMPGIVLAIAVLAFNFIGDGVNDAINPRSRRRL